MDTSGALIQKGNECVEFEAWLGGNKEAGICESEAFRSFSTHFIMPTGTASPAGTELVSEQLFS